jgi:hypothetical protein
MADWTDFCVACSRSFLWFGGNPLLFTHIFMFGSLD